jgi:phosphonate transport system substrate-binding protein
MTSGGLFSSRRSALALMPGVPLWLSGALEAEVSVAPLRLAMSESLVTNVNLNDARAAMKIFLSRIMKEFGIVVDFSPNVFESTEEIVRRARGGTFDCVALNVVEYRQIADFLDPSQIIAAQGSAGMDRYLLLAKRDSGIRHLADLRGRTLLTMKHPKMCVANAWLSNLLEDGGSGPSERFFKSLTADTTSARVVLPVFFGQADACLTYGQSFDTMCELNPQVGQSLEAIASSSDMVVNFYVFRKDFHGMTRDTFTKVYSGLPTSPSGQQIALLFQFDKLVARGGSCLAPALAILEKAGGTRNLPHPGSRKE